MNEIAHYERKSEYGNPKEEPLHYGEMFNIWSNLAGNHGLMARYQTFDVKGNFG